MKETVLVSLCAFGVPCRYHGKTHKMGHELYKRKRTESLREQYHILPLCGEQLGGLPTPRPGCEIVDGQVLSRVQRVDYTAEYEKGAGSGAEDVSDIWSKKGISSKTVSDVWKRLW